MTTKYPRVAIVTGATSGIGEATARKLVASGYAVIGNGRNESKLERLEQELGSSFCGVQGDASQNDVIESMFEACSEAFGEDPNLVIANAGRGLGGTVMTSDLSEFEEVMRINVVGLLNLVQRSAKRMIERLPERPFPKYASDIVLIGSVVGRNISPFSAVYSSTKFAVHSIAESLRREIGPQGVRVTLVEPGVVVSGFQKGANYSDAQVQTFHEKFGPLIYGEDIADTIDYLVKLPPHVHVSDIVVRPTRQDYP